MLFWKIIPKGVITESKSGRTAILADRVIDCTGDADVCFLAGVDCRVNSKEDKMSVTSVFNCSNVEREIFGLYQKILKPADWGGEWNTGQNKKKVISNHHI